MEYRIQNTEYKNTICLTEGIIWTGIKFMTEKYNIIIKNGVRQRYILILDKRLQVGTDADHDRRYFHFPTQSTPGIKYPIVPHGVIWSHVASGTS